MKRKIKSILLIYIILFTTILLAGCQLVTVVPLNTENESQFYYEDTSFDPTAYVEEKWGEIAAYAKENAHPITEIIALYTSDKAACGEQYGHRNSDKDAWNYIVSGSGKVLNVNTESKNGLLELDLEPYDGNVDAYVQVGPVVKDTAIRNSMPFISFQDFKNQLTFGDVSKAINQYSADNISSGLTLDSLQGKTVTLLGVFAESEKILIVPIEISAGKE